MKATRWDDVLFSSEPVGRRKSTLQGSDESLFSILLEIENRLRASKKHGSEPGPIRRRSVKLDRPKRLTLRALSRYIE
jgi:hypothetical protein